MCKHEDTDSHHSCDLLPITYETKLSHGLFHRCNIYGQERISLHYALIVIWRQRVTEYADNVEKRLHY